MKTKKADCEIQNRKTVEKAKSNMYSKQVFNKASVFFKVMGDCTRLRILWALNKQELCVNDLANVLDMTKSAISHQLKSLKEAKIVKYKKEGKNVFYSLNDNHIKTVLEMALTHINEC